MEHHKRAEAKALPPGLAKFVVALMVTGAVLSAAGMGFMKLIGG